MAYPFLLAWSSPVGVEISNNAATSPAFPGVYHAILTAYQLILLTYSLNVLSAVSHTSIYSILASFAATFCSPVPPKKINQTFPVLPKAPKQEESMATPWGWL
ncbi:hypothetical protein BKA70DRAFT_1397414 [Coprinopsis sp. MPI-PUGE-AT-0042]|nr:hypothetical protein BKA70DRAFT_1397414 [Coprinopsis sp. MPI-PUGE-AT-0042]